MGRCWALAVVAISIAMLMPSSMPSAMDPVQRAERAGLQPKGASYVDAVKEAFKDGRQK
jgi:hypothetical protein